MVLPLANTAAGGTDTTVATQGSGGNTGGASGDYFTSVVGNVTFSDDHPGFGTLGYRCNQAVAGQAKVTWGTSQVGTLGDGATAYTRHYTYVTAYPNTNSLILQARGAAGNAYSLRLQTDGKLVLLDASSIPVETSGSSRQALPMTEQAKKNQSQNALRHRRPLDRPIGDCRR